MANKVKVEEREKMCIPQLEEREAEIEFILQQAEVAARKTTYQWVV